MCLTRKNNISLYISQELSKESLHKPNMNTHFSQSREALITLSEGKLNWTNIFVIYRDNKVAVYCVF